MAETQTVVLQGAVAQDGHTTTFGTLFAPGDGVLQTISSSDTIGIIYDVSTLVDLTRYSFAPTKLVFKVVTAGAPTNSVTSSVYFINQQNPVDFSDLVLPGSRGEIDSAYLVSQATGDYAQGDLTWNFEVDFNYELGSIYSGGVWTPNTTMTNNWRAFLNRHVRRSGFLGRIAFTMTTSVDVPWFRASEDTPARGPRLETQLWSLNTGHLNQPFANGRSVHCGRSGLPMGANELVEDGWTPGLYVKASWQDAEDMSQEAELPDTEGRVFDKVNT